MSGSRVYLSISIDCECDKGPQWQVARPLSFRGVKGGMAERLHPLFMSHRARPTYLLSAELFDDAESLEVLRDLGRSAELGTHLHGEFVPPDAFVPNETKAFQRDYPTALERAKLTALTDSFRRAFDRKPTSFRAGRFGIGESSLTILRELGYAVDSSVTPFIDWSDKGTPLSFDGAPTQPYHPDERAPERVGDSPLLEVPVTIRPARLRGLPAIGRKLEPRWLRPSWGTPEGIVAVAIDEIRAARRFQADRVVVLNAMFHNVEVVAGASPYAKDEGGVRAILQRLDALLSFAAREGIDVVGLTDIAELVGS